MAPTLIFTGGVGVGDTVSEAEVGRRYAGKRGVPSEQTLVEPAGLSSGESMNTVASLMGSRGLRSVVLVSDPFHMLRLRILAARLGLRAYSSPDPQQPHRPQLPRGVEARHAREPDPPRSCSRRTVVRRRPRMRARTLPGHAIRSPNGASAAPRSAGEASR